MWFTLVGLLACFLIFLQISDNKISVEEITKWLFVVAAVLSMVYVRCYYYPWLINKKRDPVLPRHNPAPKMEEAPTISAAAFVTENAAPSLLLNPDGDFYLFYRNPTYQVEPHLV